MIDNYGRKIHYARISITDRCNLRCRYCMPEDGVTKKDCGDMLRIEQLAEIAKALVALGIDKIRLSGGEPLVRKGVISLAEEIGAMEGLRDFAITTNGILLPLYAKQLKDAGVRRINMSLDTLDREKYREITRGGELGQALCGLDNAIDLGFERVKVNVVLIKDFNDTEIEDFVAMTAEMPVDIRFIELMPFEGQQQFAFGKYLPATEVLRRCPSLVAEENEDPSAPAKHYRLPGAKGRVGLIEPMSHKFCDHCNRLRITADGNLLTCLHSRREIDLKPSLGDHEALKEVILKAISEKPLQHKLNEGDLNERDMGNIGG